MVNCDPIVSKILSNEAVKVKTYGMPLQTGHVRHLDKQPLASDVFEAGLNDT